MVLPLIMKTENILNKKNAKIYSKAQGKISVFKNCSPRTSALTFS